MSNRGARMQLRSVGGWRTAGRALLAAALAAAAGAALAVDAPHDSSNLAQPACKDCHQLHWAPLANLQGTDCISCHSSRGFTSWLGSDQASEVGGTRSSHDWSNPPANAAAGAALPTNAAMRTRVTEAGTLTCGACHDPHSQTNVPFDPAASQTAGDPGRHFMLVSNGASEMCLDCHAAWAQSTETSRTWTGAVRSHPVVSKDAAGTTPLTLANAGSGGGADWTYRQTPHDSGLRASVQAGSTGSVLNLEPTYKLATNALQNFVVRFTSGPYRNVQVRISGSGTSSVTLATALGAVPATGTTLEIDRAGSMLAYDVTANAGAVANQIQDTSKSWATTGNNSPFGGAGSVTILSTTASSRLDVGKICTIASNTATVLTLQAGCLTATPAGGAWAYRINWKLGGAGTTTADGTTTTFLDSTKTLWNTDVIAGLQIRFLPGNQVARITTWNLGTSTATFEPARATPVAAGEEYVLEPAQVQAPVVAASSGTTGSLSVLGTPWTGLNFKGLLIRFTKAQNAAIQGMVSRITASTASSLTFTALPAAVSPGDAFEIDFDGNTSDNVGLGGATGSFAAGKVVCQSCHGVHYADSNATTYDDAPRAGDGKLLRRAAGDDTCDACHATGMHNSVTTDSDYDTWGMTFTCGTCHQPHGTKNIYLVKEQIVTPISGTKTVDFRDTTGAGATSFAAPSLQAPTVQVCTVCHTKTSRARNNAATDWAGHYNGAKCTTCHTHQGGFAGAESKGAVDCTNCHDYGMRVADAARTGTYHHVMEAGLTLTGAQATSYPTNATPVTDATTDKTCVQCHVDHNLFRPDMNTSIGTNGRGNNLRTRIASAPPAAANNVGVIAAPNDTSTFFGNTDYLAGTPGGICMSCHTSAQTKDRANQAPGDTKTQTATLSTAEFAASAHAYTVSGAIESGAPNSGFTVACTKCHNSDPASAAYQLVVVPDRRFALHTSADRRLRAPLGQAPLQDDHGEDFCYRCHSTTANAAALGGTTKPAANNDWYGAVTTMSAASQDVYNQMQKGTPSTPPASTSTASTLYFAPTTQEAPAEPMPNDHSGLLQPTADAFQDAQAAGNPVIASMVPAPATTAYQTVSQATAVTGTRFWRMVTFVSPPVSGTATFAAGSAWRINVYARESVTSQVASVRYMIYRWTAGDAFGGTIIAKGSAAVTDTQGTVPNAVLTINLTMGATPVALASGDKIAVDLALETAQTTTTSYTGRYFFGSGASSSLVLPASVTFQYAVPGVAGIGRHDVGTYAGAHSPLETAADIAAAKHVECEDCHEPHAAKAGLHAQGSNVAGAALTGAPLVTPAYNATNWQTSATVAVTYAAGTVGSTSPEAHVCFRCHSNHNTAIPNNPATAASAPWDTGGGGFTNQALEFSTSNASYHPVLGGLPLTDPGANGSSRLNATQLVGTDHTWTPGQTMTCTDCHNADAGSPAAQGPHGSAVRYMLAGTNKAWPYTTAGATSGTLRRIGSGNNSETGLGTNDGLFCRNCHPVPDGTNSNTVHDTFVGTSAEHTSGTNDYFACVSCHIRVPHGGKVGRLILTPNAPARYKVTGAGTTVGITMANFTKQAYRSYSTTNFFDSNGCTQHGNITTGEAW